VNDGLGHAIGDEILIETAARLAAVVRPGDTLARFGGDEFVIVADGFHDPAHMEHLAERALEAVKAPIEVADTVVRVTASIGIAITDSTGQAGDLVRDADNAMYLAKESGRGGFRVFDSAMRDHVTTRLMLEMELRVALERHELHLFYQPKVDLGSRDVVGVEALLRWDHPALGSVPPSTFIPIAEETGLIVAIGRFVLQQACQQAASWWERRFDVSMAVNVSGHQIADPDFVDLVAETLRATGVEPRRVCVELTESVLMRDTVRTADTLRRLHELGVRLSIDDFGTGYSSLAYLHRFPVDELKIDQTFVHRLSDQSDQRELVAAMVAMGRAFGLEIVAEGVETTEQARHVHDLGCHAAQGYIFARPQPPDAIEAMLRSSDEAAH
jgi:predicted signal transduction protein with EAL and GGDEF domain